MMEYLVRGVAFSKEEQMAAAKIKDWFDQLCCPKDVTGETWVSHIEGSFEKETVIFLASLSSPLYKIKKPVTEVNVDDVISIYKKIKTDIEALVA